MGPKLGENENKGSEFLESTMSLIKDQSKQKEQEPDEFAKLFSGPPRKRQRLNDKYGA